MRIRPATSADQTTIRRMVLQAGINPTGLKWQRFMVAEAEGAVIGIVQIKPHRDDSQELASLAVAPQWQGQGVGSTLVHTLLQKSKAPLHLMCEASLQTYYARFGFVALELADMPPYFKRVARLLNLFTTAKTRRLAVMRWDGANG